MKTQSNIKIITRLRGPTIKPHNPLPNTKPSPSQIQLPSSPTSSLTSLNETTKYTIFTCTSQPSNTLIITPKPITGKTISETFKIPSDLHDFSKTILKDTTLLEFDNVYNEAHNLTTIYTDHIKDKVSNLFHGRNACILFFGPTDSGKSYLLRGGTDQKHNEQGLLSRAVNDLFTLIDLTSQTNNQHNTPQYTHYIVKCSAYQVYLNNVNDLLSNEQRTITLDKYVDDNGCNCRMKGLVHKEIRNKNEYDICIKEAVMRRKMLTQVYKVSDLKRKSHFVISLHIERREWNGGNGVGKVNENANRNYAQIDFVELASSNYGLMSGVDENDLSLQGILYRDCSKVFNAVCNNIVSVNSGISAKCDTKLTLCLKNTIRKGSDVVFVNCVVPWEYPLNQNLKAVKFANWLRNQVVNVNENVDYQGRGITCDDEDVQGMNDNESGMDGFRYQNDGQHRSVYDDYKNGMRTVSTGYANNNNNNNAQQSNISTIPNTYSNNNNKVNSNSNCVSHLQKNYLGNYSEPNTKPYMYRDLNNTNNNNNITYTNPNNISASFNQVNTSAINYDNNNNNNNIPINTSTSFPNHHRHLTPPTSPLKQPKPTTSPRHLEYASQHNPSFHQTHFPPQTNNTNTNHLHYLETTIRNLEAKSNELSHKLDNLLPYNQSHTPTHSSPLHALPELEKLKEEYSTLKSDNIIFREDINRLTDLNKHLEDELTNQRSRNMELAAANEQIIQANLHLESQVKSLTNDLTTNKIKEKNLIETFNQRAISETKVKAIENELIKVQDEKTKFEIEYKVLKEKYNELQKNFTCLENTYKCVKDKHCNDIANIENKVEEMSKEMQRVQNENQMLRTNDEKKRQDIHALEIQRDMFREKYQEQKNKNNLLQSKLTEIEDDFKNIMKDKENEYNLKLKEDELKRMRIDSKVKIVNELQNRIQNYRNERLKKKNEDN